MDFSSTNIKRKKDIFRSKIVGDGKRGPFYNGSQAWNLIIEDDALFMNAVWQAYLDASRTFTGIKSTTDNSNAFMELASSIQRYFKGEEEFDHSKWCTTFIANIMRYNQYEARYGQAQKVLNMAFKYLYCCDGAEKYAEKFEPCHMPLDQYTLAWLFSEGGAYYFEWSYFDKETYLKAQHSIRELLIDDIIGKEIVIWEDVQKRCIDLKRLNT
jgi:hypothetical protein